MRFLAMMADFKKFSDAGPETPNTVTSEAFTLAESFEFGAPYPYAEDEKDVCKTPFVVVACGWLKAYNAAY